MQMMRVNAMKEVLQPVILHAIFNYALEVLTYSTWHVTFRQVGMFCIYKVATFAPL